MASCGIAQTLVEERQQAMDGVALHERLVAYTDAISGALSQDNRSGVWGEHSYARARGGAPSASVRVLLAPRAAAPRRVDVLSTPREPPPLPHDRLDVDEDDPPRPDSGDDEDDWEERITANAPSPAHTRLALAALEVLRDARLALLARRRVGTAGEVRGGRVARREEVRAAARRLRRELAPLWAWSAGGAAGAATAAARPPAWLHAQLTAHLPAPQRALYREVVAELRRAVPRLADRLGAATLPPPADDSLDEEEPAVVGAADAVDTGRARGADEAGPWLAWVRCGCGRESRRWERRLAALVPLRPLAVSAPPGSPERWVAALLHAAKQALADFLDEAKGRPVFVGGAGAGAAMAIALAAGGGRGVRGVLAVGAAGVTAEGARWLADDALAEVSARTLLVCGGRGGALAGGGAGAGAAAARRVLGVAGADRQLRLPLRTRRRLRLPQHALDAALAEEMCRWMWSTVEAAEGAEAEACAGVVAGAGAGVGAGVQGEGAADEYAHLPALALTPTQTAGGTRTVEIVEGRVVARVSGSTPLLLTPRRAAPPAPAPPGPALAPAAPLDAADIMQLPIVFVDDEPPALSADSGAVEKPVTVTSGGARGGGVRYTRVIVAKRGAGGGRGSPLPRVTPSPRAPPAPRCGPARRGRYPRRDMP